MKIEIGAMITAETVNKKMMTGVIEKIYMNTILIAQGADRQLVRKQVIQRQEVVLEKVQS